MSRTEEIILLESSKLHGFIFPPWTSEPDDKLFDDGDELYTYGLVLYLYFRCHFYFQYEKVMILILYTENLLILSYQRLKERSLPDGKDLARHLVLLMGNPRTSKFR